MVSKPHSPVKNLPINTPWLERLLPEQLVAFGLVFALIAWLNPLAAILDLILLWGNHAHEYSWGENGTGGGTSGGGGGTSGEGGGTRGANTGSTFTGGDIFLGVHGMFFTDVWLFVAQLCGAWGRQWLWYFCLLLVDGLKYSPPPSSSVLAVQSSQSYPLSMERTGIDNANVNSGGNASAFANGASASASANVVGSSGGNGNAGNTATPLFPKNKAVVKAPTTNPFDEAFDDHHSNNNHSNNNHSNNNHSNDDHNHHHHSNNNNNNPFHSPHPSVDIEMSPSRHVLPDGLTKQDAKCEDVKHGGNDEEHYHNDSSNNNNNHPSSLPITSPLPRHHPRSPLYFYFIWRKVSDPP